MTDYTQGIGAEVDALCALFGRFADKDAFSKDTPDLYKDTGIQVLVQSPELGKDTHILIFVFGTPDNHLIQVTVDVQKMKSPDGKNYLAKTMQDILLELHDAREKAVTPAIIVPPHAKATLSDTVSETLH